MCNHASVLLMLFWFWDVVAGTTRDWPRCGSSKPRKRQLRTREISMKLDAGCDRAKRWCRHHGTSLQSFLAEEWHRLNQRALV